MPNYDIPQYPTKRLRYFNNQFLRDQDFIDDDSSQISRERAFLRSLCIAGVCEGMEVTCPAADRPLSVGAGIAIDQSGRMIALDQPTDGRASPGSLADGEYFVHISFLETEDDRATGRGTLDYTRWKQAPVIAVTAKTAALPDGVVVLGSCTVARGAFVGPGTASGRQYSGLRLPGPNQGVAATLRNSGTAEDLAVLSGSLTVRRDMASAVGPVLALTNGNAYPGGAGAGAALDFNPYDPGANAPSLRVQSLGDDNGSSHLAVLTKAPGSASNALVERLRVTSTGHVGIGTGAPSDILHVRNADTVGLFESSTAQAALRLVTSEGMDNHVELANRPGGNAAISVGTAGDALLIRKDGGVIVSKAAGGVGDLTVENSLRFPNELPKDRIVLWDGGTRGSYGIGLNDSNINLFCPPTARFSLRQNSSSGTEVFSVNGSGTATFSGAIVPKVGSDASSGIYFPINPGGGTGDEAFLRYYATTGETAKLVLGINDEPADALVLWQAGAERINIANGVIQLNAPLDGSLTIRRDVSAQLGPTLTLQNNAGGAGAGGAIDFNGCDNGTNAPSLRLRTLDDGRYSSHLTFSTKASGANTNSLVERLRLTSDGLLKFPNEVPKDKIVIWDNYGIGLNSSNINLFCPASARFSLRQNSSSGTEVFTVNGSGTATFSGAIVPKVGNDASSGIYFPTNPGGGSGDEAFMRYYAASGENTKLVLGINNDSTDALVLWQAGAERINISNGTISLTGNAQFNGPIMPKVGNDASSGIYFPTNPGGGTGDEAFLRYYAASGDTAKLVLGINNDSDDALVLYQAGVERVTIANNLVSVANSVVVSGSLTLPKQVIKLGTTDGSMAAVNEVVGGIGFMGFGVTHGQLSYRTQEGFELIDCSNGGPRLDYSPGTANYPYANLTLNRLTLPQPSGGGRVSMYCEAASTGRFVISNASGTSAYLTFGTGWSNSSDAGLKTDVVEHEPVLDRVMQLRPVRFRWKADGSDGSGFIAQEVEVLFPDLVHEGPLDEATGRRPKGMSYERFAVLAIAAIKELKTDYDARLEALERRLATLEGKS